MTVEQRRIWMAERLRHSLRALASPLEIQLKLFAPFECPACELLQSFDDDVGAFLQLSPELDAKRLAVLTSFTQELNKLPKPECENTGPRRELERERWTSVRSSAREVLRSFGWPEEPPSPSVEISPGVWRRGGP